MFVIRLTFSQDRRFPSKGFSVTNTMFRNQRIENKCDVYGLCGFPFPVVKIKTQKDEGREVANHHSQSSALHNASFKMAIRAQGFFTVTLANMQVGRGHACILPFHPIFLSVMQPVGGVRGSALILNLCELSRRPS